MNFQDEKILETKTCIQCQGLFDVTDKDREFYDKMSPTFGGKKYLIPSPPLCSECRAQNILSTRNERNLYKRKCDATGKDIVSIHAPTQKEVPLGGSPDKSFKVFDHNYWWGNEWNALDYGKEFDFSRPFFDQFIELFQSVPKISLNAPMSQNSEYTNQCQGNKDCYMMFCCGSSENCYYGMWNQESKYCCDCLYVEISEHCYEVVNARECYNCHFSYNLETCSDIYFSRDLINCKNCIFCVNLDNKEYQIFNKQYSKEEYLLEKEKLSLHKYSSLQKHAETFTEFSLTFPVKYHNGKRNQSFSGDYIENSKETFIAYNCRDNDLSKYCRDSWRVVMSYDLIETLVMEYCLEVEGTSYANRCFFSAKLSKADRVFYSSHCNGVADLFGCVGVNHKSYCILNKQYTQEEYEELVPRIIEHMETNEEWGRFFPPSLSPFGYNETVAQEYFPLTKEEAVSKGYYWSEYEQTLSKVDKIIPASKLPDDISQIPDDVLNWAIECEITKKPFKIVKQELEFYRQHNLPIPRVHHNERHLRRMMSRNPRTLFDRSCDKCGIILKTTYSPERKEKVYCEECYNKEIY